MWIQNEEYCDGVRQNVLCLAACDSRLQLYLCLADYGHTSRHEYQVAIINTIRNCIYLL